MAQENVKSLENSLLIADPSLRDGTFDRSVIHIFEYSSEDGAVGYIINKPTDKKVGDILTKPMFSALSKIPVYYGGPVDTDKLVFSAYSWDSKKNFRYRLRISADEAVTLKQHPGSLLLAHIGHSSWQPEQLERELSEQVWVSTGVSSSTISINTELLWKSLLEEISPFHQLMSLTPPCPEKN